MPEKEEPVNPYYVHEGTHTHTVGKSWQKITHTHAKGSHAQIQSKNDELVKHPQGFVHYA